jgi:hypothetical protein
MMNSASIVRCLCIGCLVALAGSCAALPASAQTQQPAVAPPVNTGAPPPLFANTNPSDPGQAHMLHAMERERNVIRQKEIVDDTNQLLDLARQLKDAVGKSNKDQLSLSVVNTAAEIEKLAKTVKEKMRDGQ